MARTEQCVLVVVMCTFGACVSCGHDDGAIAENPATTIAPPSPIAEVPTTDWPFPTGVFRADTPDSGLLELHAAPGAMQMYDVTDGTPELGYTATCVAGAPATMTCTELSGYEIVFTWGGTSDAVELTLVDGVANDREVWEGTPWLRVS